MFSPTNLPGHRLRLRTTDGARHITPTVASAVDRRTARPDGVVWPVQLVCRCCCSVSAS
jgi:hypothetical protein